MFIVESPVIGSYIQKQGSFKIPKYITQIKDNTYDHIRKKAVNYGNEAKLPDIQKISNTPFDIFSDAPKKSSAQKWRAEEIKEEKLLDKRESRLENVLGNDIQQIMNPTILDNSPDSANLLDYLQGDIAKEVNKIQSKIVKDKKGFKPINKFDKMDIDVSSSSIKRSLDFLGTELKKKQTVPQKRKVKEEADKTSKKFKADKSVTGVKKKATDQIKLSDKRRKLNNPLSSIKRKGEPLVNPKVKVQKTKDTKETRMTKSMTLRRKKKVNYKE